MLDPTPISQLALVGSVRTVEALPRSVQQFKDWGQAGDRG
jgi:hypothetical protein